MKRLGHHLPDEFRARIQAESATWLDDDDDEPTCPRCRGARFLRRPLRQAERGWFGAIVRCPACADIEADRQSLLERSHLNPLQTFATFRDTAPAVSAARAACMRYADTPAGTLVLGGPTGSGKTHLANAIGIAVIEHKATAARMLAWPAYLRLLQSLARMTTEEAQDYVQSSDNFGAVLDAPLLILDDIGAEKLTEYAESTLYQLVDHRYRNNLPLVVTTNVQLATLPDRIESRLSAGHVVSFRGITNYHKRPLTGLAP